MGNVSGRNHMSPIEKATVLKRVIDLCTVCFENSGGIADLRRRDEEQGYQY